MQEGVLRRMRKRLNYGAGCQHLSKINEDAPAAVFSEEANNPIDTITERASSCG